jgi:LmbE family N-acetylglucosaminyl deacetylase
MRTLVVAPHPDDEILGCGGTLLRRASSGGELGWLIVTGISEKFGWPAEQVQRRDAEIAQVTAAIGFAQVFNLRLPTTQLDTLAMSELIRQFSSAFKTFQPEEVFLPHRADAHSDHRVVFDAAAACTKWFRNPFVRRVLAYETISETDSGLNSGCTFQPNYFVDVGEFLKRKLEILNIYQSELGTFPFPRSVEAIQALAKLRGSSSGFMAAEAFQLMRERE